MKRLTLSILTFLLFLPVANSGVGINVGFGIPYLRQYGVNITMGSNWTADVDYRVISVEDDNVELSLSMPSVILKWHPFSGSFFMGGGVGQQSLAISGTDTATGLEASVDVTTATVIAKLGWMWGKAGGGFWYGMDIEMISASGGTVDIDAPGVSTTSQEYIDVKKLADDFAGATYANITLVRLGYLF